MVENVESETVEGSMSRSRRNCVNRASSSSVGVLRFRTDWLKLVPSLSCQGIEY